MGVNMQELGIINEQTELDSYDLCPMRSRGKR